MGPDGQAGSPVRVLVVDDHQTFAELLAMAIDAQPDIRCVGHVQRAGEAEDAVVRLEPDVALVDVHLGDVDGLALAARLLQVRPGLRVIMLSASSDAVNVARAAAAGACAYLPKAGALAEVLGAIRTARSGALLLSAAMVLDLVATPPAPGTRAPSVPDLTRRELQVLELLGQGLDVNAIGRQLGIRTSTCRGYVQNLLVKFDVHTQLEVVVEASARGLITVRNTTAPRRPDRGRVGS